VHAQHGVISMQCKHVPHFAVQTSASHDPGPNSCPMLLAAGQDLSQICPYWGRLYQDSLPITSTEFDCAGILCQQAGVMLTHSLTVPKYERLYRLPSVRPRLN
jgi:hypothetical protein